MSTENKELGDIRFRKIIEDKTGKIKGWFAHRLNFTDNTFEIGYSLVADGDVNDSVIGKHLAVERIRSNEKISFPAIDLLSDAFHVLVPALHISGIHDDRADRIIENLFLSVSIRDFNALAFDGALLQVVHELVGSKYRI